MLSVDEVWDLIDREVAALPGQREPLAVAGGRRLGEEIRADADMPAFTRSAIDGFALAAGAAAGRYRIAAELQPGQPVGVIPGPGEAIRIFTGSALPDAGVELVMLEDTVTEGGEVVTRVPANSDLLRRRGAQCREGDLLLSDGARIGPGTLALLASVGLVEPVLSPEVSAFHLVTGRELVPAGERPPPGCIRDSNSALVAGLLAAEGVRLAGQRRASENVEEAQAALATVHSDLMLVSGGASVGAYDGALETLQGLGFVIHCSKVKSRPGKPLIFATRGRQVAFGLPGNPLSHFVCFHLFVRRALDRLAGLPTRKLLRVALTGEVPKSDGRETWCPARMSAEAGSLVAKTLPWRDSSDLTVLPAANALVRIGGRSETKGLAQALLFGTLEA